MKIEHLAIWVDDLEKMKAFYLEYFGMVSGDKYVNPVKQYSSYFLSFGKPGVRIELMHRPDIAPTIDHRGTQKGFAHFAISTGGKDLVNALTERLRKDGYTILSEPRTTGDGYYESVILDPEGNYIEISS